MQEMLTRLVLVYVARGVAAVPSEHFRTDARMRHVPDCAANDWSAAFFVKAFLINVDHSTNGERFSLMTMQLNHSCVPWSLWPGVVPEVSTFDTMGKFLPQSIRKNRSRYLRLLSEPRSRGMIGNYLSHPTLWSHLVADDVAFAQPLGVMPSYLIMEDDVWLDPRWVAKLRMDVAHVDRDWDVIQAVWFGASYESATINQWVDKVQKDVFTPSSLQYPGMGNEHPGNESGSDGKKNSPYLGLQVSLVRLRGLKCLLDRLPQLNVKELPCVDSMSIAVACPRRFALRGGNSHLHNWGREELLGWHTTKWVRDVQIGTRCTRITRALCAFSPLTPLYPPLLPCHSGVYQENRARATRCAGLVGLDEGNCTEANICRLASGNKFLSGDCPVY